MTLLKRNGDEGKKGRPGEWCPTICTDLLTTVNASCTAGHSGQPLPKGVMRDSSGPIRISDFPIMSSNYKMSESVTLALIMGGQAVLLAVISRLRFRCLPDPETGRCVCKSGCSEYPLQDSQEAVDAHEFTVGDGQKVLLVSSKNAS